MKTYGECVTCHDLLIIADPLVPVHPGCAVPPGVQLEQDIRAAAAAGDVAAFDRLAPLVDRPRTPNLPRAAALYAEWGWAVFPLRPGTKIPATPHGVDDATADPDRVAAWWCATPTANIGVACGQRFDVIDVDTPKKPGDPVGYVALAELDDAGAIPTVHGAVITGRGGRHLYVLPATGARNGAGLAAGIDYRAAGGYVVAPPSVVDGGRYAWVTMPSPVLTTSGDYGWIGGAA